MELNKNAALEGLLYLAGEKGLTIAELMVILEISEEQLLTQIASFELLFEDDNRGLQLIKTSESYKLVTKKEYAKYYKTMAEQDYNDSISRQTLETLAIIIYNQPITRFKVEEIRGVDSSYAIRALNNRELIKIVGKSEEIGKPNLYGTTDEFLDYLGINHLSELPPIESFSISEAELESDLFKQEISDEFKKIEERLLNNRNRIKDSKFSDDDIDYDVKIAPLATEFESSDDENQ